MKLIILIGLLLSVTAVAPKSIEQKAAGIAEQRARQLDQGPATFESRDENGEEQRLQKMLRIRQAVQEADSEQAEREAADPQADTSRQDGFWDSVGSIGNSIVNTGKNIGNSIVNTGKNIVNKGKNFIDNKVRSHVEKFLKSDMAKELRECLWAEKDVMEAGISAIMEQIKEKLNLGEEELVQAKREAADPQADTSRQDFFNKKNADEEKAPKCFLENVSLEKIGDYIIEKSGLGLKRSKWEEVPEEEVLEEEVAEE